MKTIHVISMRDDQPVFDKSLQDFLKECVPGSIIQLLTPDEYLGLQQIRWWKGVLLPKLAENGDSVGWWETTLKLAVMPDEFVPYYIPIGKQVFPIIPSITILGKKKMNQMIEGAVAKCHEYGLLWVTLPDKELRS